MKTAKSDGSGIRAAEVNEANGFGRNIKTVPPPWIAANANTHDSCSKDGKKWQLYILTQCIHAELISSDRRGVVSWHPKAGDHQVPAELGFHFGADCTVHVWWQ